MAFVSATAAASASVTLLNSVPSAVRAGAGAWACPQPRRTLLAPLHAAKGAKSVPVEVVLESKVKGKKKKGSGAGNLPGALDVEIREAQEYLDSDEQVTPSRSPHLQLQLNHLVPVQLRGIFSDSM
jgi:complement component 1 Q subcomponent-binding protein, mitochondrial